MPSSAGEYLQCIAARSHICFANQQVKALFCERRLPLPVKTDGDGYVDWLYLDENLRITRGNKGSTFVHVRA